MKKLLFVLLLVAGFYGTASAQGFFIRVGGGYNFSFAGDVIGINSNATIVNEYGNSFGNTVIGSRAESFTFGFRTGYMFTKNIGADAGFNYNIGKTFETTFYFKNEITGRVANISEINNKDRYKSSSILITPALLLTMDQDKRFSAYLRAGLAIAIPSLTNEKNEFTRTVITGPDDTPLTTTNKIQQTADLRTAVGLGFHGAVGLDVHLGKKIGIYGEVCLLSMSLKPTELEVTKRLVNDVEQKSNLSKVTYVDEIKYTIIPISVPPPLNNSSGETIVSRYIPFSSLGFNVGVKYRF